MCLSYNCDEVYCIITSQLRLNRHRNNVLHITPHNVKPSLAVYLGYAAEM